jgi:hypothetical protein
MAYLAGSVFRGDDYGDEQVKPEVGSRKTEVGMVQRRNGATAQREFKEIHLNTELHGVKTEFHGV